MGCGLDGDDSTCLIDVVVGMIKNSGLEADLEKYWGILALCLRLMNGR
jgi:hypothetical protein